MTGWKRVFKVGAYALGLAFLFFALTQVKPRELFAALARLPLAGMALLLGLQFLSELALILQWYDFAKALGWAIRGREVLEVQAKGRVVEAVTPGVKMGGELVHVYLFRSFAKCSGSEAASLVAVQKLTSVFALSTLMVAALVFLPPSFRILQGPGQKLFSVGLLLFLLAFIGGFFCQPERLGAWAKARNGDFRPIRMLWQWIIDLSEQIHRLKGAGAVSGRQYILSLGIWFLFPVKLWILLAFLAPGMDPLFVFTAAMFSYYVGMIPLAPGGIGSFEAGLISILTLGGIDPSTGVVVTLIFRFVTFYFVVLVSALLAGFIDLLKRRDGYGQTLEGFTPSAAQPIDYS